MVNSSNKKLCARWSVRIIIADTEPIVSPHISPGGPTYLEKVIYIKAICPQVQMQ